MVMQWRTVGKIEVVGQFQFKRLPETLCQGWDDTEQWCDPLFVASAFVWKLTLDSRGSNIRNEPQAAIGELRFYIDGSGSAQPFS